MPEPWFDPMWGFLPGTLLQVLGSLWALETICALMLAAGIIGYITGQPYGVWYGLSLAGLLGVVVLGVNHPVIARRYRQAEERRMQAQELS
jgi:uncharacterized membrane protein (DUF4010 family)